MSDDIPSDRGLNRRRLLIGGALAATSGLVLARQPQERIDYLGKAKLEKLVPTKVGGWEFLTTSGLVVPPEDELSDALYSSLLTRVYSNENDPAIMLLIAQSAGQTGMLQVHRPEYCYPAGGFQLSPIIQRPLVGGGGFRIDVNQLTATGPGRSEQILYWTRVGDQMPISWSQQRMAIAIDNLKGRIPDAVLVRVSTIDPDGNAAFARMAAFVEQMLGGMSAAGRKVLISQA